MERKITDSLNNKLKQKGSNIRIIRFSRNENNFSIYETYLNDPFTRNISISLNDDFYELVKNCLNDFGIMELYWNNTKTIFWFKEV